MTDRQAIMLLVAGMLLEAACAGDENSNLRENLIAVLLNEHLDRPLDLLDSAHKTALRLLDCVQSKEVLQ